MSLCRKMQIEPYLSSCTKLKSKCIKDLSIKPDTLNLIEEKVGNSTRDDFLNKKPVTQALRGVRWVGNEM